MSFTQDNTDHISWYSEDSRMANLEHQVKKFNKITHWLFNYNKVAAMSNLDFKIILFKINHSTT